MKIFLTTMKNLFCVLFDVVSRKIYIYLDCDSGAMNDTFVFPRVWFRLYDCLDNIERNHEYPRQYSRHRSTDRHQWHLERVVDVRHVILSVSVPLGFHVLDLAGEIVDNCVAEHVNTVGKHIPADCRPKASIQAQNPLCIQNPLEALHGARRFATSRLHANLDQLNRIGNKCLKESGHRSRYKHVAGQSVLSVVAISHIFLKVP